MSQEKPFKQLSETEFEIVLGGRTRTIKTPFAVVEAVFYSFISSGGVIDPVTGQVQQDILQLISSFKDTGNILLAERDDEGKVIKEGNCTSLGASDVIALFQLAAHLVEAFIKTLTQMQTPQSQPEKSASEEKSPTKAA